MVSKYTRYVVLLNEVPGVQTTREIVNAHVEHLRMLDKKGQLVMCGPFTDYKGGMVIINVDNIEDAKHIAEEDPFVKEGFRTYELRSWELSCEENGHLGVIKKNE